MGKTTAQKLAERVPPHNLEAEMSVLGAMILNPAAIDEAVGLLSPTDFSRAANEIIFEALVELRSKGLSTDAVSLRNHIGDNPMSGGPEYLLDITGCAPITMIDVKHHANIIRKDAQARELIAIGVKFGAWGYAGGRDIEEAISMGVSMILGLSFASSRSALPIGTVLDQLMKEIELGKQEFITPPYLPWVHIKKGQVVILAAGTSVGKTAVGVDWVDYWSGQMGLKCAFLEYEMSEISLMQRLVSRYSGVSMGRMDEGLDEEEKKKVYMATEILRSRKLVVEAVTTDVAGLFAKIRRQAQSGTKVIFIDHLGLINFPIPKGMNHAKALGDQVTNPLKRMAMELGIVIVLLVQLNREGQKHIGPNPYPVLQDMRDSGEIEQDADIVVMLYRFSKEKDEIAWTKKADSLGLDAFRGFDADIMHMGVTKNRNGPLGGKHIAFVGEKFEFSELSMKPKAIAKPVEEETPPPQQQELM